MSEKRTMEEIQKEYQQVCALAGQAQYQVELLKANLLKMNEQILKLNQEAEALSKESESGKV